MSRSTPASAAPGKADAHRQTPPIASSMPRSPRAARMLTEEEPTLDTHRGGEVFREVQPLHQNILVRLALPLLGLTLIGVGVPMIAGTGGAARWTLIAVFVLTGALLALLALVRLKTVVTADHLVISYLPFPGRRVPIEAIVQADAIAYSPLADGGWGWRISRRYHRVFNVSGSDGVYVCYGDSPRDRFLVGSLEAEALADAIADARARR